MRTVNLTQTSRNGMPLNKTTLCNVRYHLCIVTRCVKQLSYSWNKSFHSGNTPELRAVTALFIPYMCALTGETNAVGGQWTVEKVYQLSCHLKSNGYSFDWKFCEKCLESANVCKRHTKIMLRNKLPPDTNK